MAASARAAVAPAAVGDKMFLNLTQTEGSAVVMSVGTFIERLDAMAAGSDGYGEDGKAARAVLAKRGLTDEVVDAARNLLATPRTPEAAPPPPSARGRSAEPDGEPTVGMHEASEHP